MFTIFYVMEQLAVNNVYGKGGLFEWIKRLYTV